ncbi:uncharacterized protein LOC144574958 isoform X1 [Carex rostrata]
MNILKVAKRTMFSMLLSQFPYEEAPRIAISVVKEFSDGLKEKRLSMRWDMCRVVSWLFRKLSIMERRLQWAPGKYVTLLNCLKLSASKSYMAFHSKLLMMSGMDLKAPQLKNYRKCAAQWASIGMLMETALFLLNLPWQMDCLL